VRGLWSAGVLAMLAATALASPLEVPGSAGRVEVGGYLDGLAVAATEGGPRERPQALLALSFAALISERLRGHLTLRSALGGPFEGGHPGVYNFVHTFQNRSIYLEASEAYLELRLDRADVLAGIQKVAWGRLDGLPPTDVVNPLDYHDPFVRDFEEAKIGVPMLQTTWYAPDIPRLDLSGLRATLVYLPIAVPSRLPLTEERWFPPSVTPLSRAVLPRTQTERAIERVLGVAVTLPGDVVVPVSFHTLNHRPPSVFDDGGVGLRMGGSWREMDWDLYHYTGPETGPDTELLATLLLKQFSLDPATQRLDLSLRARAVLKQTHDVMHMTGADWATRVGGAAIRAEAAVFQDRAYPRIASDLIAPEAIAQLPLHRIVRELQDHKRAPLPLGDLFLTLDSVEWGVGADYPVHGFIPLVQMQQTVLLEPAPRLLISDPETRFIASVRRPLFQERLELELRGLYALDRGGWFIFPRASYRLGDNLRLRLGYLALGGSRDSLVGQFGNNDEVVMQARYSF
jgi:hypothetical protein